MRNGKPRGAAEYWVVSWGDGNFFPASPIYISGVRSSPSKCVFHTYLTKDCWGPLGTAGDGWGRLGTAGDGWRCWGPLGIVICNGIYIW